jgi:hypothetical protein
MASKERINKLTGQQARIALLYILECSYNTACGAIWNKKLDDALKTAESYPLKPEVARLK